MGEVERRRLPTRTQPSLRWWHFILTKFPSHLYETLNNYNNSYIRISMILQRTLKELAEMQLNFPKFKESSKVPDSLTNCGRGPQSRVSVGSLVHARRRPSPRILAAHLHPPRYAPPGRRAESTLSCPPISGEDGTKCSGVDWEEEFSFYLLY